MADIVVRGKISRLKELGRDFRYLEVLINELMPALGMAIYMEGTEEGFVTYFQASGDFVKYHARGVNIGTSDPRIPELLAAPDLVPFVIETRIEQNRSGFTTSELGELVKQRYESLGLNIEVRSTFGQPAWDIVYPSLAVFVESMRYMIQGLQRILDQDGGRDFQWETD